MYRLETPAGDRRGFLRRPRATVSLKTSKKPSRRSARRSVAAHDRGRPCGELHRISAVQRSPGLVGVVLPLTAFRHVGAQELERLLRLFPR